MYLKKGGDNDTSKGFLVPIIQLFKKWKLWKSC
jgi:hypothetical protein